MTRRASAARTLAIVFSAWTLPACRAQEDVLQQIFVCDPEAGDAQCGTDENGNPMTCYVGSAQLGGDAFCTKRCDPTVAHGDDLRCTSSGALLDVCHPTAGDTPCQSPLSCYRTDVFLDLGLCLAVPICPYREGAEPELDDSQCGISHPVCAGALLEQVVQTTQAINGIHANNLHCVRECRSSDCVTEGLPELCFSEFYAFDFNLPKTCSAPCGRFSCPPNFACAGSAGEGTQRICLPGVPGMRCTSDDDCLAGACFDTRAGFSVCTIPIFCETSQECLFLGTNPAYVCGDGLCVSAIPFQGENCVGDEQCAAELRCGDEPCPPRFCSFYSAYELEPPRGSCRFLCDQEMGCPAFGGIPHACMEDGGCLPGTFGVPCLRPSDCVPELSCVELPPDDQSRTNGALCTAPCSLDSDCSDNPWLNTGYCVKVSDPPPGATGFCRLGRQNGRLCDKDEHCATDCVQMEDGTMRCQP